MRVRAEQALPLLLLSSCGAQEEQPVFIEKPCTPHQEAPYASGIPYLGIHADPGNSDVIRCETAEAYAQDWFALQGLGPTQPNTFSPDGGVVYVTTANPEPEGCRVHALDVDTGETLWCRSEAPTASLGAVEVDEEGQLYYTTEGWVHSLTADGEERWSLALLDTEGAEDQPWGVHFTPGGHVTTVTSSGMVYLISREDGRILSQLSIPEVYGFVSPAGLGLTLDLTELLPEGVQESIEVLWGEQDSDEQSSGFSTLLGGGAFCDNTVGISKQGAIYVIGGGADEESGALVQLLVGGSDEAPELYPGWHTPTHGGSATSPSISHSGQYLVISDGTGSDTFLNPDAIDARVKVLDLFACDANTDADPDPEVCAVDYEQVLEREPMIGAPTIDDEGVVVFWEMSLSFDAAAEERDLVAFDRSGVLWEVALPEDMDWASVITATDNHLIGTASIVTPSEDSLLTLQFPSTTEDFLVVLERSSGELVWSAPLPDDGSATVSVGPDGSLYAGVYGLLSMLAVDELPDPGLVRFRPVEQP